MQGLIPSKGIPSITYIRNLFLLALLAALGGCGGAAMAPTTPYTGLTPVSYGPLRPFPPRSCSNTDPLIGGIATKLTALIARPFMGISKIDPTVEREDLADKFSIPADLAVPPVTILERNNDGIVFWHDLEVVSMKEVEAASETFCERRSKRAVWEGSAERCGQPQRVPIDVNGQQPVTIPTQVITSYRCVGAVSSAPRQRNSRP